MSTHTFTLTLVTVACCHEGCGVIFGLTEEFQSRRREDHEWFYCPNGHKQHFSGPNETERLRKQLQFTRESESFYREQAAHERRSAAAQKGHRTRVLNLVAQGICPVGGCRRNFGNVRDHMATEHPDFHTHEEQA